MRDVQWKLQKLKVRIETIFSVGEMNEKDISAVIRAVSPDNTGLSEGSEIFFDKKHGRMLCRIEGDMNLGSFTLIWNDLLLNFKLAHEIVEKLKR